MKIKTFLVSSAALAALAVAIPAALPNWNPVSTAQAQNVSVGFSLFYDGLRDHGNWISHNGGYVFVPVNVGRSWRPYTEGHWVYAKTYGWTWVSDEPFGWATYHYGRWGYSRQVGWYWEPGRKWAPAWVSWRRGGDHVAWAPLPPTRRGGADIDISISVSINERSIPDYYWVAVPTRSFLQPDLQVVIINDDSERRRIIDQTEFIGTVNIENNVVVNNVVNVQYIEDNTGTAVQEVSVQTTNNPSEAQAATGQVVAVEGEIKADAKAQPAVVTPVEEVEKKSPTREQQAADSEAGAATEDQAKKPVDGEPTQDEAKKPVEGEPTQDEAKKPVEGEPTQDQAKKPVEGEPTQDEAKKPVEGEPTQDQAKKKPVEGEPTQDQAKKKPVEGEPAQKQAAEPKIEDPDATASTEPPAEEAVEGSVPAKKKKGQKAVPCEPGTEDCPPIQY
jgi:hypothetical protein